MKNETEKISVNGKTENTSQPQTIEAQPKLQDLNLSDSFLFGEVMWDEETSKDVLEIILQEEIRKVVIVNKEQHVDTDPVHKGIRLDIYIRDDKNTIYNVEMQVKNKYNIPKRSRHYQGVIDTKLLPAGEIDYNKLNNSYVIFICLFDLFDRNKYCYTFEERCVEDLSLKLDDGTRKIFLNTKGENKEEVPQELVEFLKLVENTNIDQSELKSEKVRRVHCRVKTVKDSKEVEARYMTMLVHEKEIAMEAREEGRAEGRAEGHAGSISIIRKKLNKGYDVTTTADMLEQEPSYIENIYNLLQNYPEYTDLQIAEIVLRNGKNL